MALNRKKGFYEKYIKVPQDVILAAMGLIVLSPVILIVAILIRLKLGAPVIFKQERAGKDGSPYYMYKFRSMSNARDSEGQLLPDDKSDRNRAVLEVLTAVKERSYNRALLEADINDPEVMQKFLLEKKKLEELKRGGLAIGG